MATSYVTLPANSGWVAAGASSVLVQNTQAYSLFVTFSSTAPVLGAPYHELRRSEALTAVGSDPMYLRNPGGTPVDVPVTS